MTTTTTKTSPANNDDDGRGAINQKKNKDKNYGSISSTAGDVSSEVTSCNDEEAQQRQQQQEQQKGLLTGAYVFQQMHKKNAGPNKQQQQQQQPLQHQRSLSFSFSGAESFGESIRSFVEGSFVLSGRSCSVRDFGGNATIPSEVANMVKNLIGGGVLSLSGGIALYANSPRAVVQSSMWIGILGAVFGYFCLLIAKACDKVGAATYREAWQDTMGDAGSSLVSFCTAIKAALGNLAYSAILSQTLRSLLETLGMDLSRTTCLLLITVGVILPLCLLKNLNVLAPFSVLGTAGILLTALAMVWRYLDGSYRPGGRFYVDNDINAEPAFGRDNRAWSVAILPFCCMVFESFVMHYNSPRFFMELKDRSISRFFRVVFYSFGFSALVYAVVAAAGYLTFGASSESYILNNYSPYDPLATICRIAVGLSTLLTFPIVFIGFRDGILDLFKIPQEKQTSNNLNVLTVVLLTILTVTAIFVTDLGLINAVGGGTLATAIVFIFPALMFRAAVEQQQQSGSITTTIWEKREVVVAMVLMIAGTVLGAIGVWVAIDGPSTGE